MLTALTAGGLLLRFYPPFLNLGFNTEDTEVLVLPELCRTLRLEMVHRCFSRCVLRPVGVPLMVVEGERNGSPQA